MNKSDSNNLDRLRNLTDKLPLFEDLVSKSGSFTEVETLKGNVFMFGLYNVPEVNVARVFISANSEMKIHTHNEFEFMVVYEGKMILTIEDKKFDVGVQQSVYVMPNKPHSAYFPVDTKIISLIIPSSEGYPDAT